MNEKKIHIALKEFCKNEYWREYYESAPTSNCKRYIELEFYFSYYYGTVADFDEFKAEKLKIESNFTGMDWKHLLKYCGHNPKKAYYMKKVRETE